MVSAKVAAVWRRMCSVPDSIPDHDDDDPARRRYLGPSHRRCNRAVVTHLRAALVEAETKRHSRQW